MLKISDAQSQHCKSTFDKEDIITFITYITYITYMTQVNESLLGEKKKKRSYHEATAV